MMAVFKPLPHWLYLSTYPTREIKENVRAFLKDDIRVLTDGKLESPHQFIQYTVYSGLVASVPEKKNKWNENLENILWVLRRIYKKYLDAGEYNAYKHGLRVMTGESRLVVYPDDQPEFATIIGHSPDSLSFLETKDIGEGGLTVHETTKHFSYIESYNHIHVMHLLMKTIKSSRLAILKKEKGSEIQTFFELDKEKLISQSTITKWSLTI